MSEPIRLAKRVAELCTCSRREAERYIAGGWVRVDGVIVEAPQFRVAADQSVEIDPAADLDQRDVVTLLLHKPPGYHADPGAPGDARLASHLLDMSRLWVEDTSGMRPLKKHFAHLTLCVPLEADAAGLVVFTQDWHVARKLSRDAAGLEHEIVVEVAGELGPGGLTQLNRDLPYRGRTPPAIKVSWQSEGRLRIALKGVQAGQIAHLCEAAGLRMLSMKRIRLGRVPLGKLPPGQWRYLGRDERF